MASNCFAFLLPLHAEAEARDVLHTEPGWTCETQRYGDHIEMLFRRHRP